MQQAVVSVPCGQLNVPGSYSTPVQDSTFFCVYGNARSAFVGFCICTSAAAALRPGAGSLASLLCAKTGREGVKKTHSGHR